MLGFQQLSNRLASLKFKVRGGKLALISAYDPHSGRPHDERQEFYNELSDFYRKVS